MSDSEGKEQAQVGYQERRDAAQIERLALTVDYIENEVSDEQIDMESYDNACNSTACIVGHSVYAKLWDGLDLAESGRLEGYKHSIPGFISSKFFGWDEYCSKTFGLYADLSLGLFMFGTAWSWFNLSGLFSETTKELALIRMRMVLDDPATVSAAVGGDFYISNLSLYEAFVGLMNVWDKDKNCFIVLDEEGESGQ